MPSLNSGFVPVSRIREVLRERLHVERFASDHPELVCLSRRWGPDDRIWKKLNGVGDGRGTQWMSFDIADQLLCTLGMPQLWWEDLADVYYAVTLRVPEEEYERTETRRCQREGCNNVFSLRNGEGKGSYHPNRKFCSRTCAATAKKHRQGARSQLDRRYGKCPNGHKRTEENTYTYTNSKGYVSVRCRTCSREKQRRYRERVTDATRAQNILVAA